MISRNDLAILWSHSVFLRFFETIPCCNSNKFTFSSVEQVITWVTWLLLLWRNWKVKGGRGINCLHLFKFGIEKQKTNRILNLYFPLRQISEYFFLRHWDILNSLNPKYPFTFCLVLSTAVLAALISTRTHKLVYHNSFQLIRNAWYWPC